MSLPQKNSACRNISECVKGVVESFVRLSPLYERVRNDN